MSTPEAGGVCRGGCGSPGLPGEEAAHEGKKRNGTKKDCNNDQVLRFINTVSHLWQPFLLW